MKSVEFCYWLQGMFELAEPKQLDEKQTDLIKRHLAMVFTHEIDPSYPKGQQVALNQQHSGLSHPLHGSNEASNKDVLYRC